MKQILLMIAVVALVGCGKKEGRPATKEESAKTIEVEIRREIGKYTGELTEADYEKVPPSRHSFALERKGLTSVTGLEKLTQLTFLSLHNNFLTSVNGLENLTQLKQLHLSNNQLTDVKGLEKLTELTMLYLSENKLTDVKGLEKLTQLTYLDLCDNQLTDVKGLEKLTQLTILTLQGNPDLTKAQIAELQKALPKCKIFGS